MDACEALDSSDGSSRGEGALSRDELVIVLVYAVTIGLLLLGPQHLLGRYFVQKGKEVPFILERTSYAPLCGLVLLAVIPTSRATGFQGIITAELLGDVIAEQIYVVLLILGLAFMSVSVDVSGFFESVATRLLRHGGTSEQLTMRVFWLSTVLTYFTSNDMVIVSLTPLILELCNQSKKMKPVPMLIAKFVAANTSSIGLYIGNPTNILLADAIGLSFLDYFLLMWPVTIVAVVVTWLAVRFLFTTRLGEMCCGSTGPHSENDVGGRNFPSSMATSDESVSYTAVSNEAAGNNPGGAASNSEDRYPELKPLRGERVLLVKIFTFGSALVAMCVSGFFPQFPLYALALVFAGAIFSIDVFVLIKANTKSRTASTAVGEYLSLMYRRMPWCIAPFVVSMFCIVQTATKAGLVRRFASVVNACTEGQGTIAVALFAVLVSSLLVNCINNLPATVLWSKILVELCVTYSVEKRTMNAIIMGLLVGNNVGSYLTVVGALAGLMWMNIIRSHSYGKSSHQTAQPEMELSEMGIVSVNRPSTSDPVKPPISTWDLTKHGSFVLAAVVATTGLTIGIQLQL